MTEKRFKQVVDGVKDTKTGNTLTHPLEFTLKLNEINELYDGVFDRNEELQKENEQLKIRFREERDTAMRLGSQCDTLMIQNHELKKENEQLKSDLKSYQNMVKQYINLHIDKIRRRYVNPTKEEVAERTRIIRDLEQLKKELEQ